MKKKYIIFILILAVIGTWGSCKKDFLTVAPAGALDQSLLQNTKGLDALLVGAYSMIDDMSSQFGWESAGTNWVYGSIRGMEANKGTDTGDQQDINPLMNFNEQPNNPYLNVKWREVYEAISRCNSLIMVADKALAAATIDQTAHDLYIQQAKVLRGWYHFEAWRMWTNVPYLDEKTDPSIVTNADDIREKIIADLTEGTNLPLDMGAIGKWNKTVSEVVLAKALMQMNHDYAGAATLLKDVVATGKKPNGGAIGLMQNYGDIFDIANRNGLESVYTVQYSVNDGSGANNAGNGEVLNFPYKSGGSPGGCCGFFNPTQEYVNSFRTSNGLPLLDFTYNNQPVKNDYGIAVTAAYTPDAGPLDPRLDWAVGRRGIPYWDWGLHTGADWIRLQSYSGPYSPKKQVYKKSQEGQYTEVGNWTSGWTANGYRFIRYADVLLLLAECQIETGDIPGARTNINLVRERASHASGFVKMPDGSNAANYQIAQYPTSGYPFDTQANARLALRMERKLELGQEGHRYFDLQRWGIVVSELSRVHAYERTMQWGAALYPDASWGLGEEDVNFPIPQNQIDISHGKLVQNR
jgi:starch-binding outer membrane protein, SusD/RagB family